MESSQGAGEGFRDRVGFLVNFLVPRYIEETPLSSFSCSIYLFAVLVSKPTPFNTIEDFQYEYT